MLLKIDPLIFWFFEQLIHRPFDYLATDYVTNNRDNIEQTTTIVDKVVSYTLHRALKEA